MEYEIGLYSENCRYVTQGYRHMGHMDMGHDRITVTWGCLCIQRLGEQWMCTADFNNPLEGMRLGGKEGSTYC